MFQFIPGIIPIEVVAETMDLTLLRLVNLTFTFKYDFDGDGGFDDPVAGAVSAVAVTVALAERRRQQALVESFVRDRRIHVQETGHDGVCRGK